MIEKMTKYSFILLNREKEGFLDELSALGVMDISRSTKPIDGRSAEMLGAAESLGRRIALLEKGDWTRDEAYADLLGRVSEAESALADLQPWGEADAEKIAALERSGIVFHYYVIPEKKYDPAWEEQYAVQVVSREAGKLRMVVAAPYGAEVALPFKEAARPGVTPAEAQARLDSLNAALADRAKALDEERGTLPALKAEYAARRHELDLYWAEATGESAAEDHLTVYVGFAPTEKDSELQAKFDELGYFYLNAPATVEDNPPISFRNNWFTRQFEVLTDMYGRPTYDEFDPTPILGPFFLLFFAMCMGDAGYGLLLILIGWLLKKKVPSMAKLGPLVMILGVGTFLVGIVLHTFFGINLYTAEWVPEWLKKCMVSGSIAGYDAQMVLAVGVGVFHICLAMTVKAFCFTERYGFKKSISTWGWTLLIVGSIVIGGLGLLGVIDMPFVKVILICLGIVSGISIFLLNDLDRNPLINVGAGLWQTYNTVTGLMGDVLSYLRLYALGLAGGMLGNTFNTLAGMTLGIPVPGVNFLLFAVIILIGHALNLALSCLGAFVHPLRLTFVEYFKNSGYEGGGRNYNPLIK